MKLRSSALRVGRCLAQPRPNSWIPKPSSLQAWQASRTQTSRDFATFIESSRATWLSEKTRGIRSSNLLSAPLIRMFSSEDATKSPANTAKVETVADFTQASGQTGEIAIQSALENVPADPTKTDALADKNAIKAVAKASLNLRGKARTLWDPTCPPLQPRRPYSPGQRWRQMIDTRLLHQGISFSLFTKRLPRHGGRNHTGRITVRHRGGGFKRYYRSIDFRRYKLPDRFATVVRLEYDSNRSSFIALIKYDNMSQWEERYREDIKAWRDKIYAHIELHRDVYRGDDPELEEESKHVSKRPTTIERNAYYQKRYAAKVAKIKWVSPNDPPADLMERFHYFTKDGTKHIKVKSPIRFAPYLRDEERFAYILCPKHISVGDRIISSVTDYVDVKPGNSMKLKFIPAGTLIHNVEFFPQRGGKICRAAGTSATLVEKNVSKGLAIIRMQSTELRYISLECMATIGEVSNPEHKNQVWGKAGESRHRGIRPTVCGTSMNPCDHPHGGGEGHTQEGRHPVSPWGKPAKGGYRTRKRWKDNPRLSMRLERRRTKLSMSQRK